MSIEKTVAIGLIGNELSKQITGTNEVSPARTLIATGAGATAGAVAAGALTLGATAAGIAAAPITVPLAVGAAAVSFIASLFD